MTNQPTKFSYFSNFETWKFIEISYDYIQVETFIFKCQPVKGQDALFQDGAQSPLLNVPSEGHWSELCYYNTSKSEVTH